MGQEGEEAHGQLEMLGVTEGKLIKSGCPLIPEMLEYML